MNGRRSEQDTHAATERDGIKSQTEDEQNVSKFN